MSDWPNNLGTLPAGVITPASPCCVGDLLTSYGRSSSNGLWTSGAWITANTAIYIPFYIELPVTVYNLALLNGATVSGNFDIGIYDSNKQKLVSSGSTAQAGTSVFQSVDITDTLLVSGQYFLALNIDNTTSTVFSTTPGGPIQQAYGIQTQAVGSVTLPTTATFANPSSNRIPLIGAILNPVF